MRIVTRAQLRRRSVPQLVRALVSRHPELRDTVGWGEFTRIAQREGVQVTVRQLPPSQHGRLVRVGPYAYIQINSLISRAERTMAGMHELCHLWRDDPGVACFYSDTDDNAAREEFADIFAWAVTSTARIFVPDFRTP